MPIRIKDHGANAVLASLGSARQRKPSIDVGILGSKASRAKKGSQGVTVGDVARWAELGLGQPQRSWLRGWIDANTREIEKRIEIELKAVAQGKRTRLKAMKRIGAWLQGQLQLNIADFPANKFRPNAESTKASKGSAVPLIDKGQLRSAISHRVNEDR